jgi:HSP20 family molecular chaperone IbpA
MLELRICSHFSKFLSTNMAKPFRYGLLVKLVMSAFFSFFLLIRIEGTGAAAAFTEPSSFLTNCSAPETKVLDTNDIYKVTMDIPGVMSRDLDVSVDTNERTITLIGNRMDEAGDLVGCYQKSWQLDESIDLQSLVMEHGNGVLTVWVPKSEQQEKASLRKKKSQGKAMVRGSKTVQPKRRISRRIARHEEPLSVDAISYDEQELLESVSVLTDEEVEREYWFQRM